jgi:hypothetical protein
LFVEDVAAAFDTVLHKGVTGEVYNIGTQKERTVRAGLSKRILLRSPLRVSCTGFRPSRHLPSPSATRLSFCRPLMPAHLSAPQAIALSPTRVCQVLDVAHDIAAVFKLPEQKIVHVRDRAFNDR